MEEWRELLRGETKYVDYKAPMAWDDVGKAKLLKHIIAMSNIRDGGRIVIGVSESPQTKAHESEGLSPEQLSSFDPTKIAQYVNAYVQPGVRGRVERPVLDGKPVIVLEVAEFDQLPNVCIKPGPLGGFNPGDVLIRTDGCESRRITTSEEMRALLKVALGKTADTLLRDFRQILEGGSKGDGAPDSVRNDRLAEWSEAFEKFTNELEAKSGTRVPLFECIVSPLGGVSGLDTHAKLRMKLQESTVALPYWPTFPNSQYGNAFNRSGSIEGADHGIAQRGSKVGR